MYKIKYFLLLLFFAFVSFSFGILKGEKKERQHTKRVLTEIVEQGDTLKSKGSELQKLLKAKQAHNWEDTALAYLKVMAVAEKSEVLKYSDSVVQAALHTSNNELIGNAYLKKGILYYQIKEHGKALDNYLLADVYIAKTAEEYLTYKVKFAIAQTKYYLGFYDEAIALLTECLEYFREENDRAYINSLHSLALCYNKIGDYRRADEVISLGKIKTAEFEIPAMIPYFLEAQGINDFSQKKYTQAITKLTAVLVPLTVKSDFANTAVAEFYIAKSYWELNQKERALPYLLSVDSTFVDKRYIRPDLRENYEMLIKYYEGRDNDKLQLRYINRLLEVDRILTQNYKYLSRKIFKEYDTKKLISTRQKIENTMKFSGILMFAFITVLVLVIIMLFYRNQKNKRLFKELMHSNPDDKNKVVSNSTVLDMKPEVVQAILRKLEKFEQQRKYLETDMNLIKIASILNTNTKYTSRIIVHFRGKRTIDYISDLKIDYLLECLKTENRFRNYTNKALGEEIGFGSTQNFTKAFNQRTGLSPTYFISQLRNSKT